MSKKKIIKSAIMAGVGIVLIGISLMYIFPKNSGFFDPKRKTEMVPTAGGYSIPVLTQNEEMEYEAINFQVDGKIVDSLKFTQDEVRGACSAGLSRARKYLGEFIHNGTPKLKMIGGKIMVSIPILVSKSNRGEMFITGEVTRAGQALPMRATREEEI